MAGKTKISFPTPEPASQTLDIRGHIALITGGGRRIGAQCVRALSRAGAKVVVHCHHSTDDAMALCQGIQARGGHSWLVEADLGDGNAMEDLIPRIEKTIGPLSILINNAAIFEPGTTLGTTRDQWDRHLDINLTAPFFLMSQFAKQLPREAPGKIINIIDQRVLRPAPGHAAYTATKSALWSLTRMAAVELAPNIQVNAIGPGAILPAQQDNEATFQALVQSLPIQRPGRLEEISSALLFFLANDYVTGQMVCIDGGQHL
ncbi:MAG: SDR family oxidoreductase [Magnetococcales bacterium]|nr:SDR family oxidoreductase [Magnetococcales bacterium]